MTLFLCLYRQQLAKRLLLPGGPHDPTHPQYVDSPYLAGQVGDDVAATMHGVKQIIGENKAPNTVRQYQTRMFEFFEFSDYVRPNQDITTRYMLTEANIFYFIWYTAYRSTRPTGPTGKRKNHRENEEFLYFDSVDYERLKILHGSGSDKTPTEPSSGVSKSHFAQLKSALIWLHEEQIIHQVNDKHFDFIWTPKIKLFETMVNDRKVRMVRLRCSASPPTSFLPLTVLSYFPFRTKLRTRRKLITSLPPFSLWERSRI
jgi:hypothetical protein